MSVRDAATPTPTHPTPDAAAYLARGRGLAALWTGVIAPPAIWAWRIAAAYILVPYACREEARWLVHLPSVIGILATTAVTFWMWRLWKRAGGGDSTEKGGVLGRSRFMAAFGVMNGIFWIIVMTAEELASIYIGPCITFGHPLRWLLPVN